MTIESFIKKLQEFDQSKQIVFCWHGGYSVPGEIGFDEKADVFWCDVSDFGSFDYSKPLRKDPNEH